MYKMFYINSFNVIENVLFLSRCKFIGLEWFFYVKKILILKTI